jgi:hypothetical protein
MIPENVLVDCRARTQAASEKPTNRKAALVIIVISIVLAGLLSWLVYRAIS